MAMKKVSDREGFPKDEKLAHKADGECDVNVGLWTRKVDILTPGSCMIW